MKNLAKIFNTKAYEKLAELLGKSRDRAEFEDKLIRFLESENGKFNKARFLKAVLKWKQIVGKDNSDPLGLNNDEHDPTDDIPAWYEGRTDY